MTVILMFTILILDVSRDFTLYYLIVLIFTEEDCVAVETFDELYMLLNHNCISVTYNL